MPTTVREPNVSITLQSADQLVGNKPQRILAIGQKVAGGTATAGELQTQIQNDNSWDTLFGENSMLAGIVRNARRYNTETRIDAIPLDDDGTAVQATGQFAITGTATAAGTLTFIVGSKPDHAYEIPVASGDAAATVASALETAVQADTKVPVSASATTGDVDLTADNGGTVGNTIALKVEGSVAGISVAITAMSGGSVDPSFTGLFDVIEDERYQTIIWPYSEDIDTVKDFLDARFNVTNNILDGVSIIAIDDTFSNLETTGNGENSQSVVILGDESVDRTALKGGAITEIPYAVAAQVSGIRALRLTDGASIGRFVISRNGSLDRFGGPALASLPYFNTPVPELPLMDSQDGFTAEEVGDLNDAGVSVYGNNIPSNEVLLGEIVTTYKTDPAGNEDVTFKFLNYVDTSSVCREFIYNNLKARFNQHRLTEGPVIPGRAMANPARIEASFMEFYQELANLALTQDGETALDFVRENLSVSVNLADGEAVITAKLPIVTQLRTIISTLQIAFSVEG